MLVLIQHRRLLMSARLNATCVTAVANHPALNGLSDADLANWSCSVHEVITLYPTDTFTPLAIGITTVAGARYFADGTYGIPYVLARGASLVSLGCGNGRIDPGEQCDDGNIVNGGCCLVAKD